MWTPRKARIFSILIFWHLSLLAAAPAHAQGTRMQRVRAASPYLQLIIASGMDGQFETADAVAAGERIHQELFHPEDSTRRLAQDSTTKRGNNDHGHVSTGTTPLGH
jgi:hypothetical protein